MITTGFDERIKIQQIVENQLPEFIISESPKVSEFLKQYYISQEFQGGPVDIAENLDQYQKLNNFTPDVIAGLSTLTYSIDSSQTTIYVDSTKGFPSQYGLIKIDDEIITYAGITTNSFTDCKRGFSGIVSYHDSKNPEELQFSSSKASLHTKGTIAQNLSSLFLKEFYKKIKQTFAPGFENIEFIPELNVNQFIKNVRSFYQTKGTEESYKILYKILYGIEPKIINLEDFLIKPSNSEFIRREVIVTELISTGSNPNNLVGQVIKSSDNTASAPVSEVELIRRNNKNFYKIQLFAGFDNKSLIEGTFKITPKTKVIDKVNINDSVITVDSTIGFNTSGTLICESNVITYKDKSINQFFGCADITNTINIGSDIQSDEFIYGYENGDVNKEVKLRITGVLSSLDNVDDIYFRSKNDLIYVKHIGDKIKNPQSDKTYKEFIFNSWIYNTSSRYEILSFKDDQIFLYETPDKSSLKVGDSVNILDANSENIIIENAIVTSIIENSILLNKNITGIFNNRKISIRKNIDYVKSTGIPLKYSNIVANIQNTYNDSDKFIYVASNSLPSYNISLLPVFSSLSINSSSKLNEIFLGKKTDNDGILKYTILSFEDKVPFVTGDSVVYTGSNLPIDGLEFNQTYYIEVLTASSPTDIKNKIRLYKSKSFLTDQYCIEFNSSLALGTHKFTLKSQEETKKISPKKILRKIPLKQDIQSGIGSETNPGPIGILINGVEIINYKSNDYIYYGPLIRARLINSGRDYDVINPPKIIVSNPSVSSGTTSLIDPILEGSLTEVIVDPNDVDVKRVLSVSLTGGNGSGAVLEPVITNKYKELSFNAQLSSFGGGIDKDNETITFLDNHELSDGTPIVYNTNGNNPIGIGLYGQSNTDQEKYLLNGSVYYPKIINTKSIFLYQTLDDLNSGINTVGFTTINAGGIHKFRKLNGIKVLSQIKVLNSGEGYQYRSLKIKPIGVSTSSSAIYFKDHGFKNGDLIYYRNEVGFGYTFNQIISGLSTSNQYYVLKLDNSTFRLSDAGNINASPNQSNFNREKYIKFSSIGSGQHIFEYPPIKLNLDIEYGGSIGMVTAVPVLKGSIIDSYLYEPGTDYGSNILNFHKKPLVSIRNGIGAELKPILSDGKIVGVEIQNKGKYYTSSPNLIVSGSGLGAKLRAVVVSGRIEDVIIISSGTNYNQNDTRIRVESSGRNASIEVDVRSLSVNNYKRFSDEILLNNEEDLTYGIVGYSTDREGIYFQDPNPITKHSKIIGWAYDGNPIYGPYGYSDPNNDNSPVKLLNTGYEASELNVYNRPNNFELGFFVEDYKFLNSGDLDASNGRFSKTPEFPYGTYAYYVGLSTDLTTNKLKAEFPYFIGNKYRSNIEDNLFNLNQYFDFNNSKLIRNTFPYRVNQNYSKNDFIIESNKSLKQASLVESVSGGSIDSIDIINSGDNYAVGDLVVFDSTNTEGEGVSADVKSVFGKNIVNISTTNQIYENSLITRKNENQIEVIIDPFHNLIDGDIINISGVSTSSLNLSNSYRIGVSSEISSLIYDVPLNLTPGIVTDIYISPIPKNVSIGSTIGIGTEKLSLLNVFEDKNIIRVKRGISNSVHPSTSLVNFYPNKFLINLNTKEFDSEYEEKVYFNPDKSVGLGTISGTSNNISFYVGNQIQNISIETQSIYLPNHPFKNNQKVLFVTPVGSANLVVRNTPSSNNFTLPATGNSQYVYIIKKSKDFIGIVTQIGLTTSTNGLYFTINGDDDDSYYFQPSFNKITANVEKITSIVSVSTFHNLKYNDVINLTVKPNLSRGVGNSNSVNIKYNLEYDKLLVNTVGFSSLGIKTETNSLYLPSHSLSMGQKVFYKSNDEVASGLSTGGYFVYRIDSNNIQLCDTYTDVYQLPPNTVSIGGSGGSLHELSLINPEIKISKNNNLVFDISDSSLSGYKFKLFFDQKQNNEFISIGNTSSFSIAKTGLEGNPNSKLVVGFTTSLPNKLYYNIEKDGFKILPDLQVKDGSSILYVDSIYNGKYNIFGIGSTTFSISLNEIPEKNSYIPSECDVLEYTTSSTTALGGINEINLISGGFNYTKLPYITGISTTSLGSNAILKPNSKNIGKIEKLRILNEGFEYSVDKTLKPKADIPRLIKLQSSQKINKITTTYGGKNFLSEPIISLVNTSTNKKVISGVLKPEISGSSILKVNIIKEPNGLENVTHKIFTEKNTNGVSVERVISYINGIVTCEISTPPIDGFITPPFKVGDYIFVEGIQKQSFTSDLGVVTSPGTGFNSADNGYQFFEVVNYINSIPAVVSYNIGKYTENAGIPITIQTQFTSIVNIKNYPTFKVTVSPSLFYSGETLLLNGVISDLVVENCDENYIKITGSDRVLYNDTLSGLRSGNIAKVEKDINFDGSFTVDYSNKKNYGWKDDSGKLNLSSQVIPDNDYYQTLSYSIKTSGENYRQNKVIGFETIKDSINRLVHPTGMKNFADVGITSSSKVGIGSNQILTQILDFISEKRVDTYNDFDLALDYNSTQESSNAIILRSKKLSDYIQCLSNRVLQIDDISNSFSSSEFNREDYTEAYEYSVTDFFSKFLVQIVDDQKISMQTSELVVLNNYDNTYTLNKSDLYTSSKIGTLSGDFGFNKNSILKFVPDNPREFNYNIKIYRDYFSRDNNIGVGYTDLGFLRLNSRVENLLANNSNNSIGITTDIFRSQISSINSVYANVFVLNKESLDMNYFEVLAHHDGTNGYINEFYFDTENNISGSSFGFIGTFGVSLDNGVFKLNFTNNTNNLVMVKSKCVGFGTTSSGIGTYRFLVDDQDPGTENSARLESSYKQISGISTISTYNISKESTIKSLVKVSVGSTVALHQILIAADQSNVVIQQYPYLSTEISPNSGIGTFDAIIDNTVVKVKFYPDEKFSTDTLLVQSFDQILYFEFDEFNIPNPLNYGISTELLQTSFYGSLNNFGKDRLSFDLNYERTPIFQKFFNPKNTSTLNQSTGEFFIPNHFFQNNEELIYTPGSSLPSVIPEPIGIGSTLVDGKIFEGDSISGLSTITGIANTLGLRVGDFIISEYLPENTTIVSIGSTYTYFVGNVVSSGSSTITGVANTESLLIGSGIYSGNNVSVGNIVSIGINSITSSSIIAGGDDRVYYSSNLNYSLTLSQVSTATSIRSQYTTGIQTNICPTKVYAIKLNENKFQLTGSPSGIAFTFTSQGSGNFHKLEMKKKNEKSLITVDGVVQYPIIRTPVFHQLQYNGGSIGAGITFIGLSGISSVSPRDLLKVDEEFFKVRNVGFGTTNTGPVSGLGTIPIVEVDRGFVGTTATSHTDGTEIRVYKGSYNIVGNQIHFTEAPDGRGNNNRLDSSGLPLPKSYFNGRVFLRKNYETNIIYDDLSDKFTGIGRTFILKKDGKNISGIEPGNGMVFINDIFQTPDTENNQGNNYELDSSITSGISTITFTSITRPNTDDVIIVPYDVNQNQLPRGGVIVSLGSTGGLGYAPLVGASVTAIIGVGGSIVAVGVGSTDISGSGYYGNVSIAITDTTGNGAIISPIIGAGGTLSFNVVNGGSGYTNPIIKIDSPSYQNLSVQGVSRLSVGNTTDTGIGLSITVELGPSQLNSLHEVKSFSITNPGYAFSRGDKIKLVGLVTDSSLSAPIEELILSVDEVATDSFACWQLGEFDFIDSIKEYQNGSRKRFPLFRNNELLSFEKNRGNVESNSIDFDSVLLIFINGVMQEPKVAYNFEGGTTFTFTTAPLTEDNVAIFFYRGTAGEDSFTVDVIPTVKRGDILEIKKNDQILKTFDQDQRIVSDIVSADLVSTGVYLGDGIDSINYRPINWIKQKTDLIINEAIASKSRDSIETIVVPTAKIIKDVSSIENEIFVDDASLFKYEENQSSIIIQDFEGLIIDYGNLSSPSFVANVSAASTISSITILDGGNGYTPNSTLKLNISNPIGIGTRATAIANVSIAGTISSTNIINPGFGYTASKLPNILCESPQFKKELIPEIKFVEGFSGIITGITTSSGTNSNPLALTFNIAYNYGENLNSLKEGYPILISQTFIGNGVTSINSSDNEIIGIGTTFLDNIYIVNKISRNNLVGVITCNVLSSSNVIGISTFGEFCGRFSWGKLSGITRTNNSISIGVSGYTVNTGLTTFPEILRRGYGLRNTGGLSQDLPLTPL